MGGKERNYIKRNDNSISKPTYISKYNNNINNISISKNNINNSLNNSINNTINNLNNSINNNELNRTNNNGIN